MARAKKKSAGTTIEDALRERGYEQIAGVDEVGRGPLAGPVVACALMLPPGCTLEGVTDSKQVSDAERRRLAPRIMAEALAYGIGVVDPAEIDRINILQASLKAMRMALGRLPCDAVIVDGRHTIPNVEAHQVARPRADSTSVTVAAASILAKVTRDDMMLAFEDIHPGYGFGRHKGYAAASHFEALDRLGPCPIHRTTFLEKWRERKRQVELDLSSGTT